MHQSKMTFAHVMQMAADLANGKLQHLRLTPVPKRGQTVTLENVRFSNAHTGILVENASGEVTMKINIKGNAVFNDIKEAAISAPDNSNTELNIEGNMEVDRSKFGIFIRTPEADELRKHLPEATEVDFSRAIEVAAAKKSDGEAAQADAVRSSPIARFFKDAGPDIAAFVVKTIIGCVNK